MADKNVILFRVDRLAFCRQNPFDFLTKEESGQLKDKMRKEKCELVQFARQGEELIKIHVIV